MPLTAMLSTPFKKLLLLVLLMATGAVLLLEFLDACFKSKSEVAPAKLAKSEFQYHYSPPSSKGSGTAEALTKIEANEQIQLKMPREKAEAWLAKHNRNAASLLAVSRALGDTNYLFEAATNFPNDPQVQLAVLSRNALPEERRKWLEAFKASSPSNSLANYLSAADYFKNGKPDDAMQELLAASGKTEFQNYAMEALLNGEELWTDAGKSARETASFAMSDMAEENLPQLGSYKVVAQGIRDLLKQKVAAGDTESAVNLAQLGLDLAGKINSGDSGKFLINQLVGIAVEQSSLSQLNQNTAYDFLGAQTPVQAAEELKRQKAEFSKLIQDFGPAQMQMIMSDSETASYMQRLKIYGELEAMRWLIQQHPPAATPRP
jgi:hypothetical protein